MQASCAAVRDFDFALKALETELSRRVSLLLLLFSDVSCVGLFCDPMACSQAPLSMGFPKGEYWSGLPFPSPGDLSNPGIEPESPALASSLFTNEPQGKPSVYLRYS